MTRQSSKHLPPSQRGWNRRVHGEPDLSELLDDPILHALMQRDGVTADGLARMIEAARSGQRSGLCHAA